MEIKDELKTKIEPRLLARLEEYARAHETNLQGAIEELLRASLPRIGGAKKNGPGL